MKGESYSCLKLFVTDFWMGWENTTSDWAFLGLFGIVFGFGLERLANELVSRGLGANLGKAWGWRRTLLRAYFCVAAVASLVVLGKQAVGLTSLSSRGVYQHDIGASR